MINEVKEKWAEMNSLMERMGKHLTRDDAKLHKNIMISEAIGNGGNLPVTYDIRKVGDPQNKRNIVKVMIHPLYPQDAKRLCHVSPFSNDNGRSKAGQREGKDGIVENYFIFERTIINKRPQPKTDTANGQGQQTSVPVNSNPLLAALGLNEAINLAALKGMMAQPSQNQTQDADNPHANDSMYKILKECFTAIANYLSNCNGYKQESIDALKDFESVYNAYLSQATKNDTVYPDINDEEITNAIFKALRDGSWQTLFQNMYNPLDLESIIFGKPLSNSNIKRIFYYAAMYGIDPNSGRLDHLHGATEWARFGRKMIQDPQYPFPVQVPLVGTSGPRKARKRILASGQTVDDGFHGYRAKNASFNDVGYGTRYGMRNIYPIEDTELIDPNDTTDYFNSMPGIINNLRGGLNQKAIDLKNGIAQKIDTTLTDEEKQAIANAETEKGKALIFNEALMEYGEAYPTYKVVIKDISNSPNPVLDYVQNLKEIGKMFVMNQNYSNPSIVNLAMDLFAFGVACYTVGVNEVKAHTSFNLRNEAKDNISKINSGLETLINFIHHQLNLRYEPLREKIQSIVSDASDNSGQQPQAQAQQTVPNNTTTQAPITENIYNLSDILNQLNEIYG